MTAARLRLVVAFMLFAAWVGWLAYQSIAYGRFPVISRAQLLVSTIDVIATVNDAQGHPEPLVTVQEVHWPADQSGLQGQAIRVKNIAESVGYSGAGEYVLPLVKNNAGEYEIAAVPPSPGFAPTGQLFIYRLTSLTRDQLNAIPKR